MAGLRNLKCGILGYGSIGKRHFKNLADLDYPVLTYDPAGIGSSRDLVIKDCDAILVCSPSQYHGQDFVDCADAGRHVFVEKPFGYDCPPFWDSYLMGMRMRYPHLIVATGFNLRFHSCVIQAKLRIDAGDLGDLKAASFSVLQLTEKPLYLRDGIIRNWLSHEFDLAHYLLGPGTVEACTSDEIREAYVTMKFSRVVNHVYFNADYITSPQQRYFWIEGSKMSLYVNLERREIYNRVKDGPPSLIYTAHDSWDTNYKLEIMAFVTSIEDGKHLEPLATGEDGIRSLYTVMAAKDKAGTE